jgi:hypothetical protein
MSPLSVLRPAVPVLALVVLAGLGALSCSGNEISEARGPAPAPQSRPRAVAAAPSAASAKASVVSEVAVAVVERTALAALEARGFALAPLVFGAEARTTLELSRLSGIKDMFETLRDDVRAAKRTHPLAKVTSMDGFRLFDERWLASKEMSFALIGVFNRLDRRVFYPGTCGEVRFVYRLSYRTEHAGAGMSGRLPLTLNAVFLLKGEADCRDVARAWQAPRGATGTALADWLLAEGPLAASRRERWELKSIEANLQSFRLQSFVHPSLGGHIDYVLRVFHAKDQGRSAFFPAALENMPDVAALSQNQALRAELLAHLREGSVLAAIDRGTLLLPERFLAKRAVSVSPRGLTRSANRPFATLFDERDFADLPLANTRTIRSPAALLRRLDGATCVGCHQSRSIAGFHHVGEDAADHPPFDALLSGSSAHLASDLERRRVYVTSVAEGRASDEFRPLPERQGAGTGFGAPCGLGNAGFSDWKCDHGLRCEKLEDSEVGSCLLDAAVGGPCHYGEVVSKGAPHRDRVDGLKNHDCGQDQRCDNNKSGFPLGACTAACNTSSADSVCADFLDADAFQNCLRSRLTFAVCAERHVFGAGLRACSAEDPCRQDYVCVRSRQVGTGACVPPYFVYQLRLDGYPILR